jgi:acyl-CoA dehydrogenase
MQSAKNQMFETARQIAQGVLAVNAGAVDREGRFPEASFSALRDVKLLSYLVPVKLGGHGAGIQDLCRMATQLASGCLPTAMLWAMHCQQVAVVLDGDFPGQHEFLAALVKDQFYVASVTTDSGTGSNLLKNSSDLEELEVSVRVKRFAPVVSGGLHATYFLVTMRDPVSSMVRPILVHRNDGLIEAKGTWDSLGMRGTESIPMQFDCIVPKSRLSSRPFRELAARTMIPAGHLGWAACWLGAAKGIFHDTVVQLRSSGASGKRNLNSDLLRHRLGEIRLQLDMLETFVHAKAAEVDRYREQENFDAFHNISFSIGINNVKTAAAQISFDVANRLMEISGLVGGYLKERQPPIERIFRDLRSASYMYHNDHLLNANGQLVFVEHTSLGASWAR